VLGTLLTCAAAVWADEPKGSPSPSPEQVPDPANARKEVEGFWPVDAILDQAVKNIAARYNLNDIQTAETAEMMNTRVKKFLDEHQDEVWPLIRDLATYQRKGAAPDPEEAKRLGPVASKILHEAKEEIFRSNDEWREILTPQQKLVHDYDMREMTKSFEVMEHNFDEWERGQTEKKSIFPQPQRLADEPPKPPKPADGNVPPSRPAEDGPNFVSHLEAYLTKFIADFELTDTQREAATSILREITERTAAFQKAHDEELSAIKDKIAQAQSRDERRTLVLERRRITKPLDDLFAEFKTRLDQIPDQAQRERYGVRVRGGRGTDQPAIDASRGKRPPPGGENKSESPTEPKTEPPAEPGGAPSDKTPE